MTNKIDEHDPFTVVEPQISYYSSLLNCGVTAIFHNNPLKSYKKVSSLFGPVSPKNNFSLCNTVMWPFIINKGEIESDISNISNINYSKINHSVPLIKEKDINQNSLKIDSTRNKTCSENKENEDSPKDNNTNYEKMPIFLGKNLSTNFLGDNSKLKKEEISDNNEKLCESALNNHYVKDEEKFNYFMNKEKSKSESLNGNMMKKINNKNDLLNSRIKVKEETFRKKSTRINKDGFKKKMEKRKSFFAKEQSKCFMDESIKENNKKATKNVGEGDIKTKNFYYSNKIINKNYNESYFKLVIKKKNNNIKEKEKENKIENPGKPEIKKKKKGNKTPIRETNKTIKFKFSKPIFVKISDTKMHGLTLLKEHINNKDKKANVSSHNSSIDLKRDKLFGKNRKLKYKKFPTKIKIVKDSDSEEKKKLKSKHLGRKNSEFSIKNKDKRKNSDNDNSESKTMKTSKLKINKEKDNNSKNQYSIKDSINKNNLSNVVSKNEIDSFKNNLDGKENINKITSVLRRKRSISMNLEKSKLKEVAETMKQNNIPESNSNLNKNTNSLSNSNNTKIKKTNKKKFDFEKALKNNLKKMQFNLFSKDKFTNTEFIDSDYLKYTLNCMELILDIDIEKQTRLKNKVNFNFPKSKKEKKKKIALFDLDETLVHCTGDIKAKKDKYQHVIEINLPGKQAVQVGINLRPYWKQTINLIKKNYHVVIYTASHQAYADAVLDFMDPKKKYFKYRLYRNNCSLIDVEGAKFYVKDLDILNEHYDLKDVVIVDNSVLSFAYHLHNGIPIVPYYDEDKDGSLYVVGLYLNHIYDEDDLREANKTQINLDSFLEEAKKQREEEDENIIDEESADEEEEDPSKKKNIEIEDKKEQSNNNNSGKKILNVRKSRKSTITKQNINSNPRRQSHDFSEKQLISQSKLINMYYEVNDESAKTMNNKQIGMTELNKKNSNTSNHANTSNNDNKANYTNTDNGQIDCKSDLGYPPLEQNNNNSDNDSNSEEEVPVLKRGFTIIPDETKEKNKIKGKLKIIYSNFYNKFKI